MPPSLLRCIARSLLLLSLLVGRSVSGAGPEGAGASASLPSGTQVARGEDWQPEERALLEQGVRQRKAGDDRGARETFERAWLLGRSPEALAQWALAEQALGRWVEAREHLLAALEAEAHPWIVARRMLLNAALTETLSHLGQLDVVCNVAGAELRLDGHPIGRTPLTSHMTVVAGQSVLGVSAPGFFDLVRTVQIDVGGLTRVEVNLTSSVGALVTVEERGAGGDAGPATPPLARDAVMYGSGGLAAVGVAGAAVGYILREVNVRRFNDDERCDTDAVQTRSQECPQLATAFRRGEVIAIAGAVTAGVLGGVASYLWLTRPRPRTVSQTACGLAAGGVLCSGVF